MVLCYHKPQWWAQARRKCAWAHRHHRQQRCSKEDGFCTTTRPGPWEKLFGEQEAQYSSFAANGPNVCKAAWAGHPAGFVGMLANVGCRVANQLFTTSAHHPSLLPSAGAGQPPRSTISASAAEARLHPLSGGSKPHLFPTACGDVTVIQQPKAFHLAEPRPVDQPAMDLFSDARLSVLAGSCPSLSDTLSRGTGMASSSDANLALTDGALAINSHPLLRPTSSAPQLHGDTSLPPSSLIEAAPTPVDDLTGGSFFAAEEIISSVEVLQAEARQQCVAAAAQADPLLGEMLPDGPPPPSSSSPADPLFSPPYSSGTLDLADSSQGHEPSAQPPAASTPSSSGTASQQLSSLRSRLLSPSAPKRRHQGDPSSHPSSSSSSLASSPEGRHLSRRRLELFPPLLRASPPTPTSEGRSPAKSTNDTQQADPQGSEQQPLAATPTISSACRPSMDIRSVPLLTAEDMEVKKLLGSGSYGSVFQMKPRDEVGFTAVKLIRGLRRDGATGRAVPEDKWEAFEKEWEACRQLRHRNIVRFERVFWYLSTPETSSELNLPPNEYSLCIEMEYCSLGSLEKLMHMARAIRSEKSPGNGPASVTTPGSAKRKYAGKFAHRHDVRLSIARQVAAALDHMHRKGLIHRDLRPTNIVLDIGMIDSPDGTYGHGLVAKVCDLGACRGMKGTGLAAGCGSEDVISPKYQAPEVLLSNDFSPKSDVYSFGVLLWELVAMREAWEDATDAYVSMNVPLVGPRQAGLEWPSQQETGLFCSDALPALVDRCWESDPRKRPTMRELLAELKHISLEETNHIRASRRPAASSPTAVTAHGQLPRHSQPHTTAPPTAPELNLQGMVAASSTAQDDLQPSSAFSSVPWPSASEDLLSPFQSEQLGAAPPLHTTPQPAVASC